MIDLHTHILPGVDDGASRMEVTEAMLALAFADGITHIVATPHANQEYRFDAFRCRKEIARIRASCFNVPHIYLGCELNLTPENLHAAIEDPVMFTLNGNGRLLVELPDHIIPQVIDSSLRILTESGLVPIIAHAERNQYIQKHIAYASHLASLGCVLQVTASSFFGSFGVKAVQTAAHLMRQRIVHFIASDAHGSDQRRPLLAKAYRYVEQTFGEANAQLLFLRNPKAAIEGSRISNMTRGACSAFAWLRQSNPDPKQHEAVSWFRV